MSAGRHKVNTYYLFTVKEYEEDQVSNLEHVLFSPTYTEVRIQNTAIRKAFMVTLFAFLLFQARGRRRSPFCGLGWLPQMCAWVTGAPILASCPEGRHFCGLTCALLTLVVCVCVGGRTGEAGHLPGHLPSSVNLWHSRGLTAPCSSLQRLPLLTDHLSHPSIPPPTTSALCRGEDQLHSRPWLCPNRWPGRGCSPFLAWHCSVISKLIFLSPAHSNV